MKFKDEIQGDVGIIKLKGKLMGLPETDQLKSEVKAMLGQKIKKVILDFHDVKWMNSIGLGSIMACHTTLKNHDGELGLARISDKVDSILIMTQLVKIFKAYESVDDAIKHLS